MRKPTLTAIFTQMARLGMGPDIVSTSTRSPAARNRYIYYPDHLVRMPGPIPGAGMLTNIFSNFSTILTEPVFKGAFSGVLAEPAVDPRGTNVEDESVGDFITRRMGRPIAENLVSAFLHGIYAGDLYKLSARTLFPYLWHLETMDTGIVGSLFENAWNSTSVFSYRQLEFLSRLSDAMPPAAELEEVLRPLSRASVYTFRRGLNQLVTSLESALRKSSNVTIRTSTIAHSLCLEGDDPENKTIEIRTPQSNGEDDVYKHDYLVSTVSPTALAKTLPDKKSGKKLNTHSALSTALGPMPGFVNVMVVNLFYSNPNLLPIRGFGYLLPRSVPLEQNPERALGVIFGTETSTGTAMLGIPADGPMDRDTLVKNAAMADSLRVKQDTVPGTKLTVMLGGHWWDGWDADKDLPDEETAISMARAVLERHLAIVEEPVVAKARLARNAIPQYRVGYQQDMQRVHESLIGEFGGRLKIAGSWCQGAVGVNDCVRTATEVAWSIRDGANNKTGAERFGKEERYVMIEKDGRVVRESLKGRQE